ncbi:MAG: lysylphosphatidylglycerol synthase transmembrane domain-containing protein [Chloroflexota bacterium]
MNKIQLISIPISVILFALVLRSVDLSKVLDLMGSANPAFLIAALATVLFEALFKSAKLKVITSTQAKCSLADAAAVYLIGIPFGAVTPGKAGDLLKLYSLSRRTNLPVASCLAIGMLERAVDLVATIVLAAAGVLFITSRQELDGVVLFALALSVLSTMLFIVVISQRRVLSLLRLASNRLAPPLYRASIKDGMDGFYTSIATITQARHRLAMAMFFAFLTSLAISSRGFFIGEALGMALPLLYFILLVPIVTLVELLPISILGLGTREYTVIWLFSSFGVSSEHAFSLSLLIFVTTLTPLVIAGYVIMYIEHNLTRQVRARRSKTDTRDGGTGIPEKAGKGD